jgi:soluble lytic murein transglycosylase
MLGLTREESYFNPNAQSSVGAKGLMQLMPATGADTAFKHGITGVNLLNPDMNITLGCYHYAAARSQLDGIELSSVAAYNSGVGAVKQWKQSLNYYDPDLFVEQIPYQETREYVKKVFRSYWNYVRIYE